MTAGDPVPTLVPVRILNEHIYCERLAYLEWAGQSFVDSDDTVEGRFVHRRIDAPRGTPAPAAAHVDEERDEDPPPSTSVSLASEDLGLSGKLDLIEFEGGRVRPVEYKRGKPKAPGEPLWEPELIQLCAQALLLRDAGYEVDEAEVYFAGSRSRHQVEITEDLIARTVAAVGEVRANAAKKTAPPPLVDSPKCPRCSLVGICLPDELNYVRGKAPGPPRRLIAADPAAKPLYALGPGSRLSKRGGRVVHRAASEELASARVIDISHLAAYGNVDISSAVLRAMFDRGTPVVWLTQGGWLSGIATGMPGGNVELRMQQHRAAALGSPEIAGRMVGGKIRNSRTLLRRHGGEAAKPTLGQLKSLAAKAEAAPELDSLLGIEGTAARLYFARFGSLLRASDGFGRFEFEGRNRRPPRDRVNALLSFMYSLLVKDCVIGAAAAGLDPYVGLYHRPRFGRPALALDLAEEFRPLIADSATMTAINNGEVSAEDFVVRAGAVALTARGRRQAVGAYERRMTTELTHPLFGYPASYRRTLEIQARLLGAVLIGDAPEYRSLTTR